MSDSGYYSSVEAQCVFSEANAAYGREDLEAAHAGYQKLIDHGYGGQDVLYNLGTVCLAQNDLGCTLLSFERARRPGSSAPDLDANLALAKSRQLDQVVGGVSEEGLLTRLAHASDASATAGVFVFLWVLGFMLLVVRRLGVGKRRALVSTLAGLCLLGAVPAGLLLVNDLAVAESVHEGVVMARTLAAHDAPQDTAKVSFEVHAGLKVRLLEHAGAFVRIRLPNGLEGWAESRGVATL